MHKFTSETKPTQPIDAVRPSAVSDEAEIPLFTSPRAFLKPTKEPIEGLETPMVEYKDEYSTIDKCGEIISPRDIQDGS